MVNNSIVYLAPGPLAVLQRIQVTGGSIASPLSAPAALQWQKWSLLTQPMWIPYATTAYLVAMDGVATLSAFNVNAMPGGSIQKIGTVFSVDFDPSQQLRMQLYNGKLYLTRVHLGFWEAFVVDKTSVTAIGAVSDFVVLQNGLVQLTASLAYLESGGTSVVYMGSTPLSCLGTNSLQTAALIGGTSSAGLMGVSLLYWPPSAAECTSIPLRITQTFSPLPSILSSGGAAAAATSGFSSASSSSGRGATASSARNVIGPAVALFLIHAILLALSCSELVK